jgi:hypothetical protein
MRMSTSWKPLAAFMALIGPALVVQPARAEGTAAGHALLEARYRRLVEHDPALVAPFDDHIDAGFALRAMAGHVHVQFATALDLHLGATHPAGFAHAAHLRPLGVALADGEGLRFSATLGVGFDGVTERVPTALRLPLDALAELPLGDGIDLEVGGELAWLPTSEERKDGANLIAIADESAFVARLRLGKRYDEIEGANGYFLGLELGERHRGMLIGLALGYSLEAGARF